MPTHRTVDGLDAMIGRGMPLQAALLPVAAKVRFTRCCSRPWRWRASSGRRKAYAGSMSRACNLCVPASVWPTRGFLQFGDFETGCRVPVASGRNCPSLADGLPGPTGCGPVHCRPWNRRTRPFQKDGLPKAKDRRLTSPALPSWQAAVPDVAVPVTGDNA